MILLLMYPFLMTGSRDLEDSSYLAAISHPITDAAYLPMTLASASAVHDVALMSYILYINHREPQEPTH